MINNSDECAEALFIRLSQPLPSTAYVQANQALMGFILISLVMGAIALFRFRHTPRLSVRAVASAGGAKDSPSLLASMRNFAVSYSAHGTLSLGVMCLVFASPMLVEAHVDNNGLPDVAPNCLFSPAMYLVGTTLLIVAYLGRVRTFLAAKKRAQLAMAFDTGIQRDDESVPDGTSLPATISTTTSPWSARSLYDRARLWARVLRAAMLERDADARTLLMSTSGTFQIVTAVLVSFVLFLPLVVTIAVLATQVKVYRNRCIGCQLYTEFFIAEFCLVSALILVAGRWTILSAEMVRSDQDEHGLARELLASFVLGQPLLLVAWILVYQDPGSVAYNYLGFSWEWLVVFAAFAVWVVWVPWQVFMATRLARAERKQDSRRSVAMGGAMLPVSSDAFKPENTREGLWRSLDDPAFMEICERQFVVESVRFLSDARAWKAFHTKRGASAPRAVTGKALTMCTTYILAGTPLEINIDAAMRSRIHTAVSNAARDKTLVSADVFEPAINEVLNMLLPGPYRLYLKKLESGVLGTLNPTRGVAPE